VGWAHSGTSGLYHRTSAPGYSVRRSCRSQKKTFHLDDREVTIPLKII
jgi:hypothetical protein